MRSQVTCCTHYTRTDDDVGCKVSCKYEQNNANLLSYTTHSFIESSRERVSESELLSYYMIIQFENKSVRINRTVIISNTLLIVRLDLAI